MGTLDESSLPGTAHTGQNQDFAPRSRDPLADPATASHQSPAPTPVSGPATQTVVVIQVCLDALKEVLASDDHTNRALRLLQPMLWASVVTVLGVTMIAVITALILLVLGAGPWWESLASAIGIAVIGSVGTAVVRARGRRAARRRPAIVDLPAANSYPAPEAQLDGSHAITRTRGVHARARLGRNHP